MKIGFVFDDSLDNPDGVQQYIITLGNWLTTQGHEVRYLVGQTKKAAARDDIYSLSKNIRIRFNKNRLSIPLPVRREAVQKVLAKEKFDVLHVQLPCSPMLAGRIVTYAPPGTRVIGTFHVAPHHWMAEYGARALGFWQRPMMLRFDHIVSVSEPAAAFARRNFGVRDSAIVPNVVDRARFAAAKPIHASGKDTVEVVFVGRLVERKGCRYLIEAMRRLRDRGHATGLHLTICGTGPLKEKLVQLIQSYDLTAMITLTGFVSEEEKANYLAGADLAIFPSTGGESFGIVLLEAMAAGSGVVMGGDNVGYRTVLGPQANHVLFDPKNTQDFADKIELLLDNKKLRQQLHSWQENEIYKYDVPSVGAKLLKIYTA